MFFKRKQKTPSVFKRFLRSVIAVSVLTAFVLSVSFLVKGIYDLDAKKFTKAGAPLFSRLGVTEDTTGEVAGEFIQRVANTGFNKNIKSNDTIMADNNNKSFSIAVMSDNGNDFEYLQKGVEKAAALNVDYIFHLGDLTDWGDTKSLQQAKGILDSSNMKWHAIPGDHDLAQSVGLDNFLQVFDENYAKININGATMLMLDNSANFTPVDEDRFTWFLSQVENADFIFLSQPLYHPANDRVMGVVKGEEQRAVLNQAKIMLSEVQKSNAKAIFAADNHISSKFSDKTRPQLTHFTIGALAKSRNLQTPRFTLFTVYKDGSYTVEDVTF